MKTKNTNTSVELETWYGNVGKIKHRFTQLFCLITGYEFLFRESRRDLKRK